MLRGLLRDSEAAKALFEKAGLFKSPELLEKYVIASEVTVEVLDVFLARVFGTERAPIGNGPSDLNAVLEGVGCFSLSEMKGAAGEESSAREPNAVEGLRVKVQDLERQLCAVQRQLQMQGEVSQLAAALDGRLDEIARECAREVSAVRSQASAVSEDVARLKEEVGERASAQDVTGLLEDVARLKDSESTLGKRVAGVEEKVKEAERVLRDEIQGEIKRLGTVTKMVPVDPLNGIIAHLTRECGGNVHEKGFVEVTASSFDGGEDPKYAVDLGTNSDFCSHAEPNSWIRYDFKGRRVAPTSYSIRTHDGPGYPRSWVLEVSNDASDGSWKVVDRRENNEDLKAKYVTRNFPISDPPGEGFRFVRLRQTGKNHTGNDGLRITSLEVFGTLSSHKHHKVNVSLAVSKPRSEARGDRGERVSEEDCKRRHREGSRKVSGGRV